MPAKGWRNGPDYLVEDCGHTTRCWVWQKCKDSAGYGCLKRDGFSSAHRWYYSQHKDPIPSGLHLDHLCRNPSCVNPDHLEPVTNAENVQRGEGTPFTWDDVHAIRRSTLSASKAAAVYGVSKSCIQHIRDGSRWKEATCS